MRGSSPPFDVGDFINGRPIGARQWGIVALCALVALLDGLDLQAIGLAAPAMSAALHISPRDFGAVFSAALAGLAAGAFLLGPLADRVGRKTVLVAATLCFGLFTLATASVGSYGALLLCRFLAGFGLGGAMPSFISLASEYVPRPRRTTIVALLWAGFPLGGVVGGLLGSRIIPAYGWPSIFVVGGIVPIVVSALLLLLLPESLAFLVNSGRPGPRIAATLRRVFPGARLAAETSFVLRREQAGSADMRELFRGGRAVGTILLWIASFFAFLILVTNSSWTPILLRDAGIPIAQSAVALAAFNFGSLIGSATAGALVARFGAPLVLAPTLAAGAVAYGLIGAVVPSVAAITAAESAFGLLVGCASSGLIALAAIFYPSAIRSTGVGWATAVARIGSFTGPLVAASLVGAGWAIPSIFAAVAGATLIGAVACLALRARREELP